MEEIFTTYPFPAALKMFHARATGGDTMMAGTDHGAPPPEAKAAVGAELARVFKIDRREYIKSTHSAMSLAEAVRQLLPKAEVTAVSGTGVVPKEPTDIQAADAAVPNADVVILAVGGRSAWSNERTEGEGSDTANKDLPPPQVGTATSAYQIEGAWKSRRTAARPRTSRLRTGRCTTPTGSCLRAYLAQLQRATAEGVPVKGYFQWSTMDNFEWNAGLSGNRFGLVYVDFKTQKRTPKMSAHWFREAARHNVVV